MLNNTFGRATNVAVTTPYIAPPELAELTVFGNSHTQTGTEHRLDDVFGYELWSKLDRMGISPQLLGSLDILEVCAGTGFLAYHILARCKPQKYVMNDISPWELEQGKQLIEENLGDRFVDFVEGDVHQLAFHHQFDLVIGNSFLHHFHNVPSALQAIRQTLRPGGYFISLHEPTPMAVVLESGKMGLFPLAVMAPKLTIDMARRRHHDGPSDTDLWLFQPRVLRQTLVSAGFETVKFFPLNLTRPIVNRRLMRRTKMGSESNHADELAGLRRSIKIDGLLNRVLPPRFFGSLAFIARV